MPKATIAIFDPNITQSSPAGSCLLAMVRAASERHRFDIFTSATDLQSSANVRIHSMRLPSKPVLVENVCFTISSVICVFLSARRQGVLKIATQGGFPFCDVSYAHCCHKLFVNRYRAYVPGGVLARTARMLNHRWGAAMETIAFRRARSIIVPSAGLASDLAASYGPEVASKVRVIPNPVDCGWFAAERAKRKEGTFTFAFCALGNFEWKGLGITLQALSECDGAQLVVIGGAAREIEQFGRLAHSQGVAERVTFVGFQRDVRPFLWSADAFVLPSAYESFSLVCFQAAAAGLPLIATKLYGVDSVLRDGVSGWQVDRTVESVSAAMRAAVADPGKSFEMGQNARLFVQEYDEALFRKRWLDVLGELCG